MAKTVKPSTSSLGKRRTTTSVNRSASSGRYVAKPDTSGPVWQVHKSANIKETKTKSAE